jgi:polysaccharide pyruvyl transferase WcaK-like protein
MKWLLISTIGKNPGDEFIRVGVKNLIKEVDENCSIKVLDKEAQSMPHPVEFDKCIWAGMPVFWSLFQNNNWNINWWRYMVGGWPSKVKNNFCVLGAGSFQDWSDIDRGLDRASMSRSAQDLSNNSFLVTARDPIVNNICNSNFPTLTCPAIFSTANKEKTKSIKACNLMPNGAHYDVFNPSEGNVWRSIQEDLSLILIDNGFKFFAHSDAELNHAIALGWQTKDIISYNGDPDQMLEHYRNVDMFFGNRVHGCIVSRANGADVISCGYDSRQEAVKISGAKAFLPSNIDLNLISKWASSEPKINKFDIKTLSNKYIEILENFKNK